MNLMTIKTKYVITDTPHLLSPIGYNHTQPVYEQTTIAIHCDSIPLMSSLPKTDGQLYLHDIEKITSN